MISIIQTGGKQYLVKAGTKIQVEKLAGEVGQTIKFEKVLMTSDGKEINLGKPFVNSAVVEGKILKQGKSKKIHVLKYRPKSKYRRKIGSRQQFTEVEIIKL